MIIKDSAGQSVDLSRPENVRRGMVFEDEEGANRMVIGDGSHSEQGQREAAAHLGGLRFLGCDPALARREDCERFGIPVRCEQHGEVSPVDAGAHGFARTRDGFAVDLTEPRAHVPGMVFDSTERMGGRTAILRDFGDDWWESTSGTDWHLWKAVRNKEARFLGLDMRHADAADVERMCCSTRDPRGYLCTLAIGPHDEHEDLATGTRWSATPLAPPAEPKPRRFGWYSAQQAQVTAVNVWRRLDGTEATVTMVTPTSERPAGWPDFVGVGEVTEWVRRATTPVTSALSLHERVTVTFGQGPVAPPFALVGKRGCPECPAGLGERCGEDCPRVVRYRAGRCGAMPQRGQKLRGLHDDFRLATGEERCVHSKSCSGRHSNAALAVEWTDAPEFVDCAACGARVMPDAFGSCTMYHARDPERPTGHEWQAGALCMACDKTHGVGDLEWRGDRLAPKRSTREQDGVIRLSDAEQWAQMDAETEREMEAAHRHNLAEERRAKEAALVELVNAVPEGLDPVGWRAAVLCLAEGRAGRDISPHASYLTERLRSPMPGDENIPAVAAYRRAIAPHKAPPPERKRRGLPVDDGRDE